MNHGTTIAMGRLIQTDLHTNKIDTINAYPNSQKVYEDLQDRTTLS